MKILQVVHRTYPAIGGVELHTAMISKKLVEMGHEVTIVTFNSLDQKDCGYGLTYQEPFLITNPTKPSLPKETYWNGVRILRFPSRFQIFSYFWSPEMFRWLIQNIKHFDIAHNHSFRFSNTEFTVIAQFLNKRKVPLVFTCHDPSNLSFMGTIPLIIDEVYRRTIGIVLINSFSKIIALSKTNYINNLKDLFADPKYIVTIPNGVDLEKYGNLPDPTSLREKLGNPAQLILFIGRFIDAKNPDKLILAFDKIANKYPKSKLLLIGKDYGLLDYCKKLAYGIKDRVIFLENASENKKMEALALADICVIPSSYEVFGIVALEAQASGVPVLSGKKGGLADIVIDGKTGLHIDPTPDCISKSISYLLDNPYLRQHMGKEGKKFVKKYSWSNTAAKLESVYIELCK